MMAGLTNLDIVALQGEAERRAEVLLHIPYDLSAKEWAEAFVEFAVEVVKRHCDGHGLERRPGAGTL
jgi:hypothetical protein